MSSMTCPGRGISVVEAGALAARAQAGDQGAFSELYRAAAPLVLRFLRWRAPRDGSVSAEDLAADTWVRAWRALPGLPHTDNVLGWLTTIARNVLTDHLKSAGYQRCRPADPHALACRRVVPDHADQVAHEVDGRALVAKMPAGERRVVVARAAGYSHTEVAAAYGTTVGATKGAYSRALERARHAVTEAGCAVSARRATHPRPCMHCRIPTTARTAQDLPAHVVCERRALTAELRGVA